VDCAGCVEIKFKLAFDGKNRVELEEVNQHIEPKLKQNNVDVSPEHIKSND